MKAGYLGPILLLGGVSLPAEAMIHVECSNYTITYPDEDGNLIIDHGRYCWWQWTPDPADPPYAPPVMPAPPGEPEVPNPGMCQTTLDGWPAQCSKIKRPFLQLNGCGTDGIFGALVPDNFGPVGWTGACNTHDQCYGTYGMTKAGCDTGFVDDMKSACNSYYGTHLGVLERRFGPPPFPPGVEGELARLRAEANACWGRADSYGGVVDALGGQAFTAAQQVGQCIKAHDDRDQYCGVSP